MIEGVSIEQLRTLSAVVEAGSFTAAARKLGRVQGAVSQTIERLESQLGLRLFDRSGRIPKLTSHGEAVAAAATRTLGDVRALEELVGSLKRGEETSLRIVVDVMVPTESVVSFAREFRDEHLSVDLVLFSDVLSGVTAHVREKRSAWGLAIEDADMTDLDYRAVAQVRLVPVVAPDHPLARAASPVDAATLEGSVQVVLGEHRPDEERGKDAQGVFSSRRWRVVDLATKHALIAGGLGWGHMPEHLVREDLRAGRLVSLDLEAWGRRDVARSLVLVRRRDAVMGKVAKWAQSRLTELCRERVEPESAIKRRRSHQSR
jgi:DNA-binding transcriptional LysR family regulator